MIEEIKNIWRYKDVDARCITTNGAVATEVIEKHTPVRAVMGRGVAKEARIRYPGLDSYLAMMLLDHGNHVHKLLRDLPEGGWLLSFPVKHHWREAATKYLITRSAHELVAMTTQEGWKRVVLPRPGCGNGRLTWEQVRPMLENVLDDRFIVVTDRKDKGK